MVKENRILIFIVGFLCAALAFSVCSKKGTCQNAIPQNISFAAESNTMYFLDRDQGKIYRYNIQGKLSKVYTIKELGKDLTM